MMDINKEFLNGLYIFLIKSLAEVLFSSGTIFKLKQKNKKKLNPKKSPFFLKKTYALKVSFTLERSLS